MGKAQRAHLLAARLPAQRIADKRHVSLKLRITKKAPARSVTKKIWDTNVMAAVYWWKLHEKFFQKKLTREE